MNAANKLGINFIINYNRKSRQDEDHEKKTGEDTLSDQRKLMERTLAPYGIPYKQVDEIGSGDKISTRPVFQGVIEDLNIGKYQAIAVKEISRMGRGSYTDMGIIYDLIVGKRIFIITPWKLYDPKNPADLKQIRFELFMSREEFETTNERLSGGRFTRALEGRWMAGKPPFGYDLDPRTRKLVINENEARVVRIIFDYFVNGIPDENGNMRDVMFRALATHLRKVGIKTPMGRDDWRTNILEHIAGNDVYIGTLKYRTTRTIDGKVVPRPKEEHVIVYDAHPAIIDLETFQLSRDKLDDPSRRSPVRSDYLPYELTGLPVCKKCGRKMIRRYTEHNYTRKTDNVDMIYEKEFLWCTTIDCTYIKYGAVVDDLLLLLEKMIDLDNGVVEATLKSMVVKEKIPTLKQEDAKQYVERKHRELQQRMKFIYEKYESGVYTDQMFLERKEEVDSEIEQLKNMKDDKKTIAEIMEVSLNIESIKKNISSLLKTYHSLDERSEKNKILRTVFDHVVIEIIEKGRGSIPSRHRLYPFVNRSFLFGDDSI